MDAIRLLSSLLDNNATGGNMLNKLLKGATGSGQQNSGGGGLGALAGLLGGAGGGQQGGGLFGVLAKAALGGGGQNGGGAAQLLGALLGGGNQAAAQPQQASQAVIPQQAQDEATLLIRAMCNAAKSDGQVDEQEQQNIIGRLGNVDQSEIDFLRQELASPLDLPAFVQSVPRELAPKVYALSLMTVRVDTDHEVAYLQQLAQGLQLDRQAVDQIHQQVGLA
jgi:uncharacterized membrane protein YebE (DUF533 family)